MSLYILEQLILMQIQHVFKQACLLFKAKNVIKLSNKLYT